MLLCVSSRESSEVLSAATGEVQVVAGAYFLGPIVTAQRDGIRYLVDGQQEPANRESQLLRRGPTRGPEEPRRMELPIAVGYLKTRLAMTSQAPGAIDGSICYVQEACP